VLVFYRGHAIVVLHDEQFSAEITEAQTGTPFPTKVTAHPDENPTDMIARAKALIDLYLVGASGPPRQP